MLCSVQGDQLTTGEFHKAEILWKSLRETQFSVCKSAGIDDKEQRWPAIEKDESGSTRGSRGAGGDLPHLGMASLPIDSIG